MVLTCVSSKQKETCYTRKKENKYTFWVLFFFSGDLTIVSSSNERTVIFRKFRGSLTLLLQLHSCHVKVNYGEAQTEIEGK